MGYKEVKENFGCVGFLVSWMTNPVALEEGGALFNPVRP
jgi:hypothetical protein